MVPGKIWAGFFRGTIQKGRLSEIFPVRRQGATGASADRRINGKSTVKAATSRPSARAIFTSDTKVRLCSPRSTRPT